MSVGLGFVALRGQAFPEFETLTSELKSRWSGLTVEEGWRDDESKGTANEDDEDSASGMPTLFATIDGAKIVVAQMPAPIPWSELEGPCATSILWENAETELRNHDNHLIVTVMADGDALQLSIWLTQAIAATVAATDNVVGVYYGNATLVVQPDLFVEMAELIPDELPLFIWIDFRAGTNENGTTSGFTAGMEALGHKEIECENASEPPGEFRERLFGLCSYLIENGAMIQHGHTVGADANEKIKVQFAPSAFGHEGKVMRLNYESVHKKSKPFWKFW